MSLRAQQLSQRFVALDLASRSAFLKKLHAAGMSFSELPVIPADRSQALPLSYAQQSLWLTWQLDPLSAAYNMPGMMMLTGDLDAKALEAALHDVQSRHEALHSRIDEHTDPASLQAVPLLALPVTDLSSQPAARNQAEQLATAFTGQAFVLNEEAPFRVHLYCLGQSRYLLALAVHHIAADAWSLGLLIDELVLCYEARAVGLPCPLPALQINHGDYARWQRDWLDAGEAERQLAYWREALGEEHPVLALPYDYPERLKESHPLATLPLVLSEALNRELRTLAQQQGASLYMVVLALFGWCLHRFTGQDDVRIGSPVANRSLSESHGLVAYLSNVLVLRGQIDESADFITLLKNTRETVLAAQSHADMPFDLLVSALQPTRQPGVHPLFQVKCTEQTAQSFPQKMGGLALELQALAGSASHFDLSLDFTDFATGIEVVFAYAADLFEAQTIERFAKAFHGLAHQAIAAASQPLAEAVIAETSLQQSALEATSVLALWQASVTRCPDAAAIRFEGREYSYGELDQASTALAQQLLLQGAGAECRVAIYAERSCEFVLGMLAVLKAGACYIPLDPQLPIERLQYQLQGTAFVLSKTALSWAADVPHVELAFNGMSSSELALPIIHPQQAAYIIYTSGSTGKPKGVVVSHGALANYVHAILAQEELSAEVKSMAMVSTVAADLGHTTLYGALCSGRLLHLISTERAFDPDLFAQYMQQHQVDVLKIVPSHLQALLQAAHPSDVLPARCLIVGGEATSWALLERIATLKPQCKVLNHYGPSETTVGVLTQPAVSADRRASVLPLGGPLAGVKAYVLDSSLQQTPQGVAGELYLGGAGLARGYFARPDLSAERFIPNPYAIGERLYRSGDRVRILPNGSLAFLGRVDDQVKIRGYRVEPSEVASALLQQDGVAEAFVMPQLLPDGRTQLIAYVVTLRSAAELKASLLALLPDYMVPTTILTLTSLPLNANGKVDRKALPEPYAEEVRSITLPLGEVETAIAQVWEGLLNKKPIGRHDNFFELGGDSIISLQIVARLRRAGYKLAPKLIFEKQTIAELAKVALPLAAAKSLVAKQVLNEAWGLTPIQARFLNSQPLAAHHRNQSLLLQSRSPLDVVALSSALSAILQQHDALRLRYVQEEGRWTQSYADFDPAQAVLWQRQVGDAAELEAECNLAQRSLDLATGPLLRAVVFDLADGSQRVLLVIHHLVVDGVSWRILLDDLQVAYEQAAQQQPISLPDRSSSYQAWGEALSSYPQQHASELNTWLALAETPVSLPCDDPAGSRSGLYTATHEVRLDQASTQALLQQVPAAYRTQINDVLLTALGLALGEWTGSAQMLIDLEGHGREDVFAEIDLSRSVGWFTSLFPVQLSAGAELGDSLKQTKEMLRAIPHKGLAYGVFKYLGDASQQASLASMPQPQLVFNYLGQFEGSFDADSLWSVASEASGDVVDPAAELEHELAINGQIFDGMLSLNLSYSSQRFKAATIIRFAQLFEQQLQALIAHCCSGVSGLTPSDVPLAKLNQTELDGLGLDSMADLYPLSPMQAGMLFHSVFDPQGGAYLNQLRVDIQGLDAERFKAAWQSAIARHDVLRTGFLHQRDLPLQWVAKQIALPWQAYDWQTEAELELALDTLARAELEQGFVLEQAGLTRLILVQTGRDSHHFIWTNHHLITDGWSTSQLMGDVLRAYDGAPPAAVTGRYRDYIGWLQSRDAGLSETWWRQQLAVLEEPTRLASSLAKPKQGAGYGEQIVTLNSAATQALQTFAKRERITVNTLVQAAWALLLSRYTGQQTVCFGATTSGRPTELAGSEQMQGMFINTLPVMCTVAADLEIGDWLRQLQAQNLSAREHEHTPLYEIQRWAGQAGQGLFDSIVVFENYPIDEALKHAAPSKTCFALRHSREQTNYPLTLALALSDELSIHASYEYSQFADADISRILAQWQQLLVELSQQQQLGHVQLSTASEQQALQKLGSNPQRFDASQPVHRLIEAQVAQRPDAIALIFGEIALSYAELNRRANQLAHQLIAQSVGPEVKVGIALERSIEMVVSLLAVLKAGGAYVPLDPDYPADRLAYMVEDSGITHLLTQSTVQERIPHPAQVLVLDRLDLSGLADSNPELELHGDNLAYVIYTSGSTGKPKGVAVEHGKLAEYSQGAVQFIQLQASDRVLQFSTLNFDGFVEQFYPTFCAGAALVLRGNSLWDSETFYREVLDKDISVADLTTAYWSLLAQDFAAIGPRDYGRLRQVHAGGEAMPPEGLRAWYAAGLGDIKLLNTYGPTEILVEAAACVCSASQADLQAIAIGQPLPGRALYILDAALNLCPQGVAGELYIGGSMLARGYLNRPELSAERFIADPFNPAGGRLYRTGDLVRWRADGQLEYLGRLDHQVKIRGFRIELGEVEAQLLAQDGVREAVVVAQEARLLAYVSLQAGSTLAAAELKAELASHLPDYMVPSVLMILDQLPLNPNGKVDRKALPQPEFASAAYEAPQGEIEEAIAEIWTNLLGHERVGRHDHFFELGGHSLLAMQMISRVQKQMNIALNIADIFQAPDLFSFSSEVAAKYQKDTSAMLELDAFISSMG